MTLRFRPLIVVLLLLAQQSAFSAELEWQHDLDQALVAAKNTGRPVLIDFWATWCAPCAAMDRELWNTPQGKDLSEKFVRVRLDFDRSGRAIRKFRIDAIPAVIFTDSWGNQITKLVGFEGPEDYLRLMKKIPGDYKPVDAANAQLANNPANAQALRTIARFYHDSEVFDLSNLYYEQALDAEMDPAAQSEIQLAIAWNQLKLKDYGKAHRSFRDCLEYKDLRNKDVALFGMVVSSLGLKDRKAAEGAFEKLNTAFPGSEAAKQAARLLKKQ